MLKVLKEFFCTPDNIKRHKTSCVIFNAQMREEVSITDYVLYMIKQIEHLSKFDFFLHEQLRKDTILNSLPKFYLPFLNHFRMTKPVINYHDLLGLLQTFEKSHRLYKKTVNVVGGSSSGGCHFFKKGKKKIIKRSKVLGVRPRS